MFVIHVLFSRLPQYTAPEILCYGPVQVDENTELSTLPASSPKTDVWSLGCLLLEAMSVSYYMVLVFQVDQFFDKTVKLMLLL